MYIFVIVWILSPLALIPLFIKKSKENKELKGLIDDLFSSGRISTAEYLNRKVEKAENQPAASVKDVSAPVFTDNSEFSRVYGGDAVETSENSNTVSDENSSAAVCEKPAVPDVRTEAYKMYDLPVYTYKNTSQDLANTAYKKSENKIDNAAQPTSVKPVETIWEKAEHTKLAGEKNKKYKETSRQKRAAAMSVLMMIGIIFVILAGLVFSTAVWASLGEVGRTCTIAAVAALFFGVSAFTKKKLKLERTAFAFYTLGTFFSSIVLITAGFFGLTGSYFSVTGEGCFLLYAAALLIISLLSARGLSIFDIPAAAYISAFSASFSTVLILVQISPDMGGFALLSAILTAVINIFMYVLDIKISDKWEKPLRIVTAVLNIIAIIGGISAAFGGSPAFYAAAAIFVLRSIAAAVMGFMGRRIYKTSLAAISSLASGALFALLIMFKLSASAELFALFAALFGILFAFGMFTFNIAIPKDWNVPVKMSAFILNAVGIISSFYALMRSFGAWDGVCFAIAGIYIVSSFASGIMAVRGHNRYSEASSAFASMFTGLAFSVMLVAELSASGAIAALCLTIMLLVFVNVVYTIPSKLPETWRTAAGVTTAILGLISVFSTLFALIDNFGGWDAACYTISALYILQSIVITIAAYRSHGEYSKTHWAVISQLIGTFFSVLIIAQLAVSNIYFMMYITIFAVAYLNFVHTFGLKRPEKWVTPLKVFSYLLGIFGVIFTISQMYYNSEWTYHFYITLAIYIIYSIAVTAMAFLNHGEYSKPRWAFISQFMGIIFSLCIIYKIAYSMELFILIFAAFAVLYSAAVCVAFLKMPEKWIKTINVTDIIFNAAAAVSAAVLVTYNFSSWNIYCFLVALLYIGYTAVRGIRNGNSLLKVTECFISSITAYNLYCAMADENIIVPEFFLVCMLFSITMIHHFAKPLRTLFSDIYLTAALAFSAVLCALEYNICGVLGFALLGTAMLIRSAEDNKISNLFKALLPLPVTGIVFTFVYYNISDLFGTMAAADAVVLALISAAIMLIRKKSDVTFYSFALISSVLIFIGTAADMTVMLVILLGVSVLLTALFCRCNNNLPSLLTMAGIAAVVYRLADIASLHTNFNVSFLFAVIFALLSLAASRAFYSRRFLTREEGRFQLDACCAGILLALPMVHSADEKVSAFAVLSILAVFVSNLARKEHKGDVNRLMLTVASGLFTLALIFRPFLIVSNSLVSRKITLAIICAFGFVFSKIWAKYPKLSENFSSAVYGISFVFLIIDALSHQNLLNTLIVLGVSAAILLYSFISKKKRWFAVSSVSLLGLTIYMFRDFFTMIDWWVYLLIVGLILIAVSAANEYFVRKGRELKEKAGRFFEDWKW